MLEVNRNVVNWYVFFMPRRNVHPWWMRMLDRRLAHVFAVADFDGLPVLVNHLACHTVIEPMRGMSMDALIEAYAPECSAILAVTVEYTCLRKPRLWGYMSCVTILKSALGVNGFIWTPKNLYKALLNHDNGCVTIKELVDKMDVFKPKTQKPDTKYQQQQALLQSQQERRLQEQEQRAAAKDSAARRAISTNSGSLLSGLETGVLPVTGRRTVG